MSEIEQELNLETEEIEQESEINGSSSPQVYADLIYGLNDRPAPLEAL